MVEVDERVTLVGFTSDPKAEENAIQFDDDGKVVRGYRGAGWDGSGDAEGPGEIVKGISGEAVRILKTPGTLKKLNYYPFIDLAYRPGCCQERSTKIIRPRLPFSRNSPRPLIHVPSPRTPNRRTRSINGIHPSI